MTSGSYLRPSGELRTVYEDGSTTSEPIDVAIFATEEGRAMIDSWARRAQHPGADPSSAAPQLPTGAGQAMSGTYLRAPRPANVRSKERLHG
jgi:hypothetical protein